MTTAADISPEAVESLAQYFDDCLSVCVDYDMHASLHADTCTKTAAQLRALRSALTASGEALREYGHHKNSCRFVSNVPNPGIRPGSCTCGLEAAMEKANG